MLEIWGKRASYCPVRSHSRWTMVLFPCLERVTFHLGDWQKWIWMTLGSLIKAYSSLLIAICYNSKAFLALDTSKWPLLEESIGSRRWSESFLILQGPDSSLSPGWSSLWPFSLQKCLPSKSAPVANIAYPFPSILFFLPHIFAEGLLCARP